MFLQSAKIVSFYGKRAVLSSSSFLKIPKRNGYIVLVPEIGEDLPGKYPLLKEDTTPEFNSITIEKCIAAIGRQALEFENGVKTLEKKIEKMFISLSITWGIAKILYLGNQSVMPTRYYIGIHERARKALAAKYVSLPVYQVCKNIINNKEIELTNEQRRILSKYILEGKLNGLELTKKNKDILTELSYIIMNKCKEYSEKLQVATNQLKFTIKDHATVRDFPEAVLKTMVKDETQFNVGPWTVTLDPSIMNPFMEYCPDHSLRWKVWEADVTKGSVLQEKLLQTSTLLEEIREQRKKRAKVLGYKTYADLSMETKMAGSLENIYNTFDILLETARPAQEYEIKELSAFAREYGFENRLQLWDIPFWSRKQLYSVQKYREEDFKQSFPLPKVLFGLFEIIETLFNVKIVESKKKPDVWHKDVRYFDIFDLNESSTNPVGSFYLDPYARGDEKVRIPQDSGYMVPIKDRSKASGTKPLVALIFNFQPPLGEEPSYLSFKDVKTIFRKFGHMLQHTLTTVEYAEITGLTNVEWDATFISDYFFENLLYEPSHLQRISSHQDTKEPLSMEMIQILRNMKLHLAGYKLCRELYLSRFDLELYTSEEFWLNIMKRLWDKHFVISRNKMDCHVCSFEKIFSGDWAASYYSDIWSQMIAADLYSAFNETSSNNENAMKEIGSRYRATFLAVGGSQPMSEVFRKFRGRDPNPKALLRSLELNVKASMIQSNT
ncbi:Oligopeptidase A, partial [Dufourea novaeangliae]